VRARVCHLSSAHPTKDGRIFHKQCVSLARAGFHTSLVVPGGDDHVDCGVNILAVPHSTGRVRRMSQTTTAVLLRAIEADADLYQFHDPELLGVGLALKAIGKTVIFDSHEDLPLQVAGKPWIPAPIRPAASTLVSAIDRVQARLLDAVIGATPSIAGRFDALGARTAVVANYPILDEFAAPLPPWSERRQEVVYVGGLTAMRGVETMIDGLAGMPETLVLCGPADGETQARLDDPALGDAVQHRGMLDRPNVVQALRRARLGLCLLERRPNYVDSMPIKLFEYLAAGLPVVASDFEPWRQLVDGCPAVRFVPPEDIGAVRRAIRELLDDPEAAEARGVEGRRLVFERFAWATQAETLIGLYRELGLMP